MTFDSPEFVLKICEVILSWPVIIAIVAIYILKYRANFFLSIIDRIKSIKIGVLEIALSAFKSEAKKQHELLEQKAEELSKKYDLPDEAKDELISGYSNATTSLATSAADSLGMFAATPADKEHLRSLVLFDVNDVPDDIAIYKNKKRTE
jgi:hypothetical protein